MSRERRRQMGNPGCAGSMAKIIPTQSDVLIRVKHWREYKRTKKNVVNCHNVVLW